MNYGKAIKTIREKAQLSLEDFADRIGMMTETVINIETTATRPAADILNRIAKIFNTDNAYIQLLAIETDKDMTAANKEKFNDLFPGFHDKLLEFIEPVQDKK